MKKRTIGTVLVAAILTTGVSVGAQALSNKDINTYMSGTPETSEVAPIAEEIFSDLIAEEVYSQRQAQNEIQEPAANLNREVPELAAAKEVSANLSEDEIEELHVARQAEAEIGAPRVAFANLSEDEIEELHVARQAEAEIRAPRVVSANLSENELEELHVARQAEAELRAPRVASPKINSDFNVNRMGNSNISPQFENEPRMRENPNVRSESRGGPRF